MPDDIAMQGVLQRYVFRNETTGFGIARFQLDPEQAPVTIKGVLLGIEEGEQVRVQGRWVEDPRFGRQLLVDSYLPVTPSTTRGVEEFLRSGRVPGVGKVFAQRLVAHFGDETLTVLERSPERLSEVEGIGPGRAARIIAAWQGSQVDRETLIFLQGLGLPGGLAARVARRFGKQTIRAVRANPYRLAEEVRGIGFLTADRIARELGVESDSPFRVRAGLLYVAGEASSDGHCFLIETELLERAERQLGLPNTTVIPHLRALVGEGALMVETVDGSVRIYVQDLLLAEEVVAERIAALLRGGRGATPPDLAGLVSWAEARGSIVFSGAQRAALSASLAQRVLVITGGPGTGKTTIVRAVLDLWERQSLRVRLAAPTGRAARRMADATGRDASTLHRLLEFSPREGVFLRNFERPLELDALVIDEASMIDLELAAALLAAVPDDARVLLVGDIDQLPSVGPGRVLADLMDSGVVPVERLDTIFRQDERGLIVANAHRILRGELPLSSERPDGDFFFIERDDPEEAARTVAHLVAQRIPGAFGLDSLADVQVLVPMRRGTCGAEALNEALRRGLSEAQAHETGEGSAADAGATMDAGSAGRVQPGDRVMQIRNNYDKDVFNGDIGLALASPGRGAVRVRFEDGRELIYEGEERDQLDAAFAVTIHKSQGSEYPAVVVPLLMQHHRMLQRNLLYTAVTRGRRLVVIVGSRRAVELAVRNDQADVRNTGLARRLRLAARR